VKKGGKQTHSPEVMHFSFCLHCPSAVQGSLKVWQSPL
jgi:hypothetical protein